MSESETDENDNQEPLGSVLAKYMKLLLPVAEREDRSRSYAYRGQCDSSWPLQSAAVRRLESSSQSAGQQGGLDLSDQIVQYTQHHLLREFRNRGYDIVDGRRLSVLECLSTLQHQGAATPFLDFSYSPLVALWFASDSTDPETEGKVFKIDITACQNARNEDTTEHESAFEDILDGLRYPREILAWQPPGIGDSSRRALAQQSVLLLSKHDFNHLDAVGDRHLEEFVVKVSDKKPLREDLRSAGVSENALFPDLAGFAGNNRSKDALSLPDPYELLSQANAAYNDRNPSLAADLYQSCLDIYPSDNRVKLLLTNAMADARRFHEAHKLLSEIESWAETELSDTAKSNYYFNKANVEAALGMHQEAINNYDISLQLELRLGARFNRANSLASLRQYTEAIADYGQCQDYAAAKFNAGNVHAAMFDYEGAEVCFSAAIQSQPDNENFQTNRNTILQARALIEGQQYENRVYEIAGSDAPGIMIWVAHEGALRTPPNQSLPLVGNVGNQGNVGYLNLRGGQGFGGAIGNAIVVVFVPRQLSGDEQCDH